MSRAIDVRDQVFLDISETDLLSLAVPVLVSTSRHQ